MSEVKVNKISPRTNCGTVQLGDSGDTITIPAGATITNSGTQTGFGKTGAVDFVTTAKTSNFTAAAGEGYFVNTAGGAVTVTLPGSPSAGDMIVISDYNSTAVTNNITIDRNSNKINGGTDNIVISKANSAIQLVYVDATTGFQSVATANTSDVAAQRLTATGGTITTSGDYKIHTFTGPGTFSVSALSETDSENVVDYLVVAGGGGGGAGCGAGGGGGAGGFRFFANPSTNPQSGKPGAPRNAPAGVTVTVSDFPITVGAGGDGGHAPNSPSGNGDNGSNSSFSTITSHGGGFGAGGNMGSPNNAGPGGSGGGPARNRGGTANGNTPPVSPPQGSAGGDGSNGLAGDGGGGAMGIGGDNGPLPAPSSGFGGVGGAGAGIVGFGASNGECSSCIQYFSGGGGGGTFNCATDTPAPSPATNAQGGIGGGGPGAMAPDHPGSYNNPAGPTNKQHGATGTANTGGGGGGGGESPTTNNPPSNDGTGGAGGSGIVVIRYKFQ